MAARIGVKRVMNASGLSGNAQDKVTCETSTDNVMRGRTTTFFDQNNSQITAEGVPWSTMKSYVISERDDLRACQRIPFLVALIFTSLWTVEMHVSHDASRAVAANIADLIENKPRFGVKSGNQMEGESKLSDVRTLADFYSWMRDGFIPFARSSYMEVSESELLRGKFLKDQCVNEQNTLMQQAGNSANTYLERQTFDDFFDAERKSSFSPRCFRIKHYDRCLGLYSCVLSGVLLFDDFVKKEPLCAQLLKHGPSGERKQYIGEFNVFTTILGGFRLRQTSPTEIECTIPKGAQKWWGNIKSERPKCYPSDNFFTKPSVTAFHGTSRSAFEHVEFFLLKDTANQMQEKTRDLELGCPIVDHTDFAHALDPRTYSDLTMISPHITRDRVEQNNFNFSPRDDQYVYQFDKNTTAACRSVTTKHVREGNPWTKMNAGRIVLSLLTFNRELSLWSMTDVNFIRSRAGRMFTTVDTVSLPVNLYKDADIVVYMSDGLFIIANLILLYLSVRRFYIATRTALFCPSNGHKNRLLLVAFETIKHAIRPETVGVVIACWMLYMIASEIYTLQEFEMYIQKHTSVPLDTLDDKALAAIYEASDTVLDGEIQQNFKSAAAFYMFTVIQMTLMAFHQQPRLSFVTRTMVKAAPHLFHFLIVFLFVLLCFSSIARVIFGETSADFSDFAQSLITLYRCLYGEFPDDTEFTASGLDSIARPFFVSFTVITSLVMLNVVLAILLQAYDDIRRETSYSKPLYKYFSFVFEHTCQHRNKRYASFDRIIRSMDKHMHSVQVARGPSASEALKTKMLRPIDMMTICRQIPADQAREIVLEAYEYACAMYLRAAQAKAIEAERKGAVHPCRGDTFFRTEIPQSVENSNRPHGFQSSDIAVLWALLNERFEKLENVKTDMASSRIASKPKKTRKSSLWSDDKSVFFGPGSSVELDGGSFSGKSPHSKSSKKQTALLEAADYVDIAEHRALGRRRHSGLPSNFLKRSYSSPTRISMQHAKARERKHTQQLRE